MKIFKALLILLMTPLQVFADCALSIPGAVCGPATKYEVSVTSVSLCAEATCASPVAIGTGEKVFDIASAAVGSAVGSYANMDNVISGTYTHVQTIVSGTFKISGGAIASGTTSCGAQSEASLSVPNAAPFGGTSLDVLMGLAGITWADPASKTQLKIITALAAPLTVSKTSAAPSVSIEFGTSKGLMCVEGGVLSDQSFPAPPDVIISVSAN